MTIYIGSARKDENGAYSGGKAGDQTGEEVSEQAFYVHSKGWDVLRLKEKSDRAALAKKMRTACANANIGYDQNERLGIIRNGVNSTTKTECDCSSLVRQCVIEATGKDPGNFTTDNEKSALVNTGLFQVVGRYASSMQLLTGDVLVTCAKGHTAIVTRNGDDDMGIDELPLAKYGSKGVDVAALQGALKYKGYSLSVDGDFGTNTQKQVKAFQKIKGLAQDGIVGAKTWKALLG